MGGALNASLVRVLFPLTKCSLALRVFRVLFGGEKNSLLRLLRNSLVEKFLHKRSRLSLSFSNENC